ncbi:MAG: hypothetical protein ABL929_00230 [Ferruginibacter sp.]|nr:hypothetical protein [Ferruginibacter sp.]
MKNTKKIVVTFLILLVVVIFLSQCISTAQKSSDPRGSMFANETSCRQCHQAIYDSAMLSAHFNASAEATPKNVHGSFAIGKNIFTYNDSTIVKMENRDSGMYQVLYINNKEKQAYKFDIVFGKTNAQTYLYWHNDKAYELPISHFNTAINGWATSPGFSASEPNFYQLIDRGCFECHSSFVKQKQNVEVKKGEFFGSPDVTEVIEKSSLMHGINCQRCHGPAINHVNFHNAYPQIKVANYITKIDTLNNQQRLDMCGLCHSGNDKEKLHSRFNFVPGNLLTSFFMDMPWKNNTNNFDVHGNQQRLLEQSKCFLKSDKMNCTTCHGAHTGGTSVILQSQKCMGCHSDTKNNFCTEKTLSTKILKENCIDCHMPKLASTAIDFQESGNAIKSTYFLRTHKIGLYDTLHSKK